MHELTNTEMSIAVIAVFTLVWFGLMVMGGVLTWISNYIRWSWTERRAWRDFERRYPL